MADPPSAPTSTYRLQITESFTLDDAAALAPYLAALGVDAVYLSPLLQAAAGSQHGYDVVDPATIDAGRGGEAGWARARDAFRAAGLRIVLDIVPNHLGVADAAQNAAWWDVLRNGPASAYAEWFDIDWAAGTNAAGRETVLLPVLGDHADLTRDLSIVDGELRYFEHRFPIAPGTAQTAEPGEPGESAAAVHDRQHYTLIGYRQADTRQNYRRFFAITSLAGVRVETPEVFDGIHTRIRRWIEEDGIDGLRVDHPDGLADPSGYLDGLRALAPHAWLLVEKILEPGEVMPSSWPIDGTTGYDAMAEADAVFVDPGAERALTELYRRHTGDDLDFAGHVDAAKRGVATTILQAEVSRIARLTGSDRASTVEAAVAELAVAFGVYRSYLPDGRADLDMAVQTVRRRRPDLDRTVGALLPRLGDPADEVAIRFQQLSGAVMAKGVEDTTYYRYSRFLAANEVGGDPASLGLTVADFHARQLIRQRDLPFSMTALSTHDTKRGEDVRAAIAVIAEAPQRWDSLVSLLMTSAPVPDPALGYLLWQTIAGVGLIDRDRVHAYAVKAMREANHGTGWIDSDAAFEAAVHRAVDAVYDDPPLRSAVEDFGTWASPFAYVNALGHKLIQLTMPGVPDVYQGTERWDDSLVDPDNRRPVDFAASARGLAELDRVARDAGAPPPVAADGLAKLHVVSCVLRLRRARADAFTGYAAVPVSGDAAEHLVAFDRGGVVAVATRLPVALADGGGWGSTTLAIDGIHVDHLTGRRFGTATSGTIPVRDLLDTYPVALLERLEPGSPTQTPLGTERAHR